MLEDRRSTWVWVRGVEGGEWEDGVREADAWRADLCAKPDYGMTSHARLISLGSARPVATRPAHLSQLPS